MAKGYIDREEAVNALYEADAITMQGVKILNQLQIADVVEVVRCRDCENAREPTLSESYNLEIGCLICEEINASGNGSNPVFPGHF